MTLSGFVQLNDRKRVKELMLIMGWSGTIRLLAMASSVCWYGLLSRREDGDVVRRALEFGVEGQRKNVRL